MSRAGTWLGRRVVCRGADNFSTPRGRRGVTIAVSCKSLAGTGGGILPPVRLVAPDPARLLAPIGQDGQVGRNTFRAGGIVDLDLSLLKHFAFGEQRILSLRMDIFNSINRANYGVPVRFLEAPGFRQATPTVTPMRRIQLALKFSF